MGIGIDTSQNTVFAIMKYVCSFQKVYTSTVHRKSNIRIFGFLINLRIAVIRTAYSQLVE